MRISSGCSQGEREKIHDRMTSSQAGERSSEMCGSDGECGGGRRGTKTGRFRRSGTNSDAIPSGWRGAKDDLASTEDTGDRL
jgi:hypothetical protein